MEEPEGVTTSMSKNLKLVAESVIPTNVNKTNGDHLMRKLFGTPDSKERLVQAHLKVINNNNNNNRLSIIPQPS
jgi:hypothetical protein